MPKLSNLEKLEAFMSTESNAYFGTSSESLADDLRRSIGVISCKDCKYFRDAKPNKKGFLICPASHMEIMGGDFCSYGERREDYEGR